MQDKAKELDFGLSKGVEHEKKRLEEPLHAAVRRRLP